MKALETIEETRDDVVAAGGLSAGKDHAHVDGFLERDAGTG
ncbi:hypothetical protein SDC9_185073 [bioreactor metagenome]|uniref:Uncharacterized protein n=1 Tax=bioreactor metagenome TaxID=1076179 RepID=A0A645HQA9_9ZZZZ